jgi:spore coat protein U-like protein
MRKLLSLLAAALVAFCTLPAAAATVSNTFTVSITLASSCTFVTMPTVTFPSYTAFGSAVNAPQGTITFKCTNTKPITSIRLDDGAGGQAGALAQGFTDSTTGLAYTLTLGAAPAGGTGANQTVTVDGSIASGQAGTCTTATCTNSTISRTVYINF